MIIRWSGQDVGFYALGFVIGWQAGGSVTPPAGGGAAADRIKIGTIDGLIIELDAKIGGGAL